MSEVVQEAAGKIDSQTEKIAGIIPGKIRYRGQRGPDKAPRRYNPITLRNLKQFQNTIPQKTDSNNWIWVVVGILVAIILAIIVWRIYVWRKKDKQDNRLNCVRNLSF